MFRKAIRLFKRFLKQIVAYISAIVWSIFAGGIIGGAAGTLGGLWMLIFRLSSASQVIEHLRKYSNEFTLISVDLVQISIVLFGLIGGAVLGVTIVEGYCLGKIIFPTWGTFLSSICALLFFTLPQALVVGGVGSIALGATIAYFMSEMTFNGILVGILVTYVAVTLIMLLEFTGIALAIITGIAISEKLLSNSNVHLLPLSGAVIGGSIGGILSGSISLYVAKPGAEMLARIVSSLANGDSVSFIMSLLYAWEIVLARGGVTSWIGVLGVGGIFGISMGAAISLLQRGLEKRNVINQPEMPIAEYHKKQNLSLKERMPSSLCTLERGPSRFSKAGVFIGVGDYRHPQFVNLPATVHDVQILKEVLTSHEHSDYQSGNVYTVTGSEATAANIRNKLNLLARSINTESTAFVYFSGHGGRVKENNQWHIYLCPHEADPQNLPATAISGDEFNRLLSTIPAGRLLVVVDTCHIGGSAELKTANEVLIWKSGLPKDYVETLSQGSGRVVIASSKAEQHSHVHPEGDLSLFTYHLCAALNGGAAVRGDGLVRVLDVFHYVNEAVHADEPKQTPILKVNDLDLNFPIAVAPIQASKVSKTSKISHKIVSIRERIVSEPVEGARELSEYLENYPDLVAKRNKVDLKRSQLEKIQHDLDLFGPDPSKKTEKRQVVFYLLRLCSELAVSLKK